MTPVEQTTIAPVRRSVTVNASPERAFRVFTQGIDTWWPRTHHIGKSPMRRVIVEGRVGGRCYSEQVDNTECDWGSVLVWDPPRRFVMAWQITQTWQYQPDVNKSSEVEVTFTPEADGSTRVDLEHRGFERMGPGGNVMRTNVNEAGGWSLILQLFTSHVGPGEGQAAE
jgi:uncharacterized protein YndB with AHSA1/START domain